MSSTVFAAVPQEVPFPHELATATANQFNRLKTVGNYTTWIAKRVPKDQMSGFKAFLNSKGLKPSTAFPKMTAQNEKACFDKDHCLVYSSDSVSYNGVAFKIEKKPFAKVMSDICAKIGCETKTAGLTLIPEAHAFGGMSKTMTTMLGLGLGAAVGYFAADSLGIEKSTGLLGGAMLGGLGGYLLGSDDKAKCNGNCNVSCQDNNYYYQQPVPAQPLGGYNQGVPQYQVSHQSYYHQYGQYPPPCSYDQNYPSNGPTDLQVALRNPPQQQYCPNTGCQQPPPYQPGQYNYQQQPGNPADVRTISSEKKKEDEKAKAEKAK